MNLLMKFCPGHTTILWAANVLLQIAAVAALAWLLASLFARHRPALRHGIWFSALVCVLLSPVAACVAARAGLSLVSLRLFPQPAAADADVPPPRLPDGVDVGQLPVAAYRLTAESSLVKPRLAVRPVQHDVSAPDPKAAGARERSAVALGAIGYDRCSARSLCCGPRACYCCLPVCSTIAPGLSGCNAACSL